MNNFKRIIIFLFVNSRHVFLKISCLLGRHPKVLDIKDSLLHVLNRRISISRYGDGEILLMEGYGIGFQQSNPELASRLKQIVQFPIPNHQVCIPGVFSSLASFNKESRKFWENSIYHENWLTLFNKYFQGGPYLNSHISRFYEHLADKTKTTEYINIWRQIFQDRNLLLVEGAGSRLGIYNDLFSGVSSIKRIVCPVENAFDHYQEILETTLQHASGQLVLIALGPTATVLAYDLAAQGIQALDVGHIDIEYEWYKMGAKKKVTVPGRYMNETGQRILDMSWDPKYISQIVAQIGIS